MSLLRGVFNTCFRSSVDSDTDSDTNSDNEIDLVGRTSPGARRNKIIADNLTHNERWYIISCLFLFGWAYGMDSLLRVVYQPLATSGFAKHSTLATVNVIRSVVTAATYPAAARLADVFGRLQMVIMSVLFHVIGTIIEAGCKNVEGFAAGAVIYQIGYTSMLLLVEVIVADITTLKARLLYSYVPTLPFLFNTWASGYFSEAVLARTSWRWAIGMWSAIVTVCSIPLIVALFLPYRRIKKAGHLDIIKSPFKNLGPLKFITALFWQVDVLGIVLLIAVFGFILVPFTIAGHDKSQWKEAKVLAPLLIGFIICIPTWLIWEHSYARYPMLQIRLLKDRAVWGALGIACMLQFSWTMQGNFLYTVIIVAFDESVKRATWVVSLYNFFSVLIGFFVGLVVRFSPRVNHLKGIIITGTVLFFVAFGLLSHFRGGANKPSRDGVWGAQVLLGIAGGLFPYPTQTSIQAATKHKHVALITGLYLATFNIGGALGNAVSGAIWTQTLIPTLLKNLPEPHNTNAMAQDIFASPFKYTEMYAIGTPVRNGMVTSYRHTQRLLTLTGLGLCGALIIFSCCIRNPAMVEKQSLWDQELSSLDARPRPANNVENGSAERSANRPQTA
ncbi:MFS general substrate transporter [Aaosphaeria arxii CBS 175.79]|uniref:MFS general substrate transporter n=1 Tax=Aaosphaeria arxii CBS 175.79 TaxID=1450172 RepID=A0A6A5Y7H2_9PLEO|nr:MFS general substrate transporter [Aaosphaeria arxii CBS 175.79]KAF2021173.1 MFS general substrate transporter [Aaosphaeria arxii CBS 175.79]